MAEEGDDVVRGTRASDLATATWRKSSFSTDGECLEFAVLDDCVAVRNSNNPDGGTLFLPPVQMASWILAVKAGEFDDLAGETPPELM